MFGGRRKKGTPYQYRIRTVGMMDIDGYYEVPEKVPVLWSDLDVNCEVADRDLRRPVGFVHVPRPMTLEDLYA